MRIRKIHAVLAVSVALVLVARSIDGRRRAQAGSTGEQAGDPLSDVRLDIVQAKLISVEPPTPAPSELELESESESESESDATPSPKRRLRRGPLAVAAATVVVVAVLAGTVVAVAAGAASSPSASQRTESSLYP